MSEEKRRLMEAELLKIDIERDELVNDMKELNRIYFGDAIHKSMEYCYKRKRVYELDMQAIEIKEKYGA